MMLEKESWQQISPAALKAVNLAGLTTEGASLPEVSRVCLSEVDTTSKHSEGPQSNLKQRSHAGFREWLVEGNPFVEKSIGSNSVNDGPPPGNHANIPNGSATTDKRQEDEEDNEDLLADFIDEESQLPSRLSSGLKRAHVLGALKENTGSHESLILTGSSVSFLRFGLALCSFH